MAVQGGWVGQKRSEKHVRNMWTAPKGLKYVTDRNVFERRVQLAKHSKSSKSLISPTVGSTDSFSECWKPHLPSLDPGEVTKTNFFSFCISSHSFLEPSVRSYRFLCYSVVPETIWLVNIRLTTICRESPQTVEFGARKPILPRPLYWRTRTLGIYLAWSFLTRPR